MTSFAEKRTFSPDYADAQSIENGSGLTGYTAANEPLFSNDRNTNSSIPFDFTTSLENSFSSTDSGLFATESSIYTETMLIAGNNVTDYEDFNFNSTAMSMSTYGNVTLSDKSAIRIIGIVFGFITIFVGSTGNMLTIVSILLNPVLRTPFYIFIGNLCVIDFLTSTVMMPFNVNAYINQAWPFENPFTCSFMAYSYYCCGYTSIVCLVVITVNRYVGIVHSECYDRLFARGRICLIIAISWLFAPAFLFPVFFFPGGGYGWNERQTLCVFDARAFTKGQLNYMQFLRILFQFIPLLVMIILYLRIFLKSRHSATTVMAMSRKSHSASTRSRSGFYSSVRRDTPPSSAAETQVHDLASDVIKPNAVPPPKPKETLKLTISVSDGQIKKPFVKSATIEKHATFNCDLNTSSKPRLHSVSAPASPQFLRRKPLHSILSNSTNVVHEENHNIDNFSVLLKLKAEQQTNLSKTNSQTSIHQHHALNRTKSNTIKRLTAMDLEARKRKIMDRKLLRVSVTICGIFMILFLPSVIVNLIPRSYNIDDRVHMFASVITWLNACVNPIIYCFMNARMRYQYQVLLSKLWFKICLCLKIKTDFDRPGTPKRSNSSRISIRRT